MGNGNPSELRRRDLEHESLPTGSLLSALQYPVLRQWSDRGGASQSIGEAWATLVWRRLGAAVGQTVEWYRYRGTLSALLPLDYDREAARTLPRRVRVPDFVAVITGERDALVVPLDAKFDASVADEEQVSARNLDRLLRELPTLSGQLRSIVPNQSVVPVDGIVVVPDHWTTDALLRGRRGQPPSFPVTRVLRVPATPREVYARVDVARLIGALAELDRLPVRPADDLAVATYYVRLACACRWCWTERQRPLLGEQPVQSSLEELSSAIRKRRRGQSSAFTLVEQWVREIEPIWRTRQAVAPYLDPPVARRDVAALVRETLGAATEWERRLWQMLRERYRAKLVEIIGTVSPERAVQEGAQLLLRFAETQAALGAWCDAELRRLLVAARETSEELSTSSDVDDLSLIVE